MNVKRWSLFAACVMAFLGAVSLEAGTFNALPLRSDTAICGVVHLEKAGEMCRRIGNSLLAGRLTAELGLSCSEAGWELSMRNNLPEVYPLPEGAARRSPMASQEKVLLGGGNLWLVAMSTVPLELEHLQALRKAAEEGREDAIQAAAVLDELAAMGVDDATLVGALKTLGFVMGGESRAGESPLPGGYLYVSGEEEALKKLAPLMTGKAKILRRTAGLLCRFS